MSGSFDSRRAALFAAISVLLVVGGLLPALGMDRQQPEPPRAVDKGGGVPSVAESGTNPDPPRAPTARRSSRVM
jgi:hypothetical protein